MLRPYYVFFRDASLPTIGIPCGQRAGIFHTPRGYTTATATTRSARVCESHMVFPTLGTSRSIVDERELIRVEYGFKTLTYKTSSTEPQTEIVSPNGISACPPTKSRTHDIAFCSRSAHRRLAIASSQSACAFASRKLRGGSDGLFPRKKSSPTTATRTLFTDTRPPNCFLSSLCARPACGRQSQSASNTIHSMSSFKGASLSRKSATSRSESQ